MPNEQPPVEGGATVNIKTVTLVDAPSVPEVYANNVIPSINSFDVTLHFGSIIELVENEARVARRVSIVMTPEVAKLMLIQLSSGLAFYEKNVRPIPTPKLIPQQKPTTSQSTEPPAHTG
jgi:hypothetical protein